MARIVLLDSGPLGLAAQAAGKRQADDCRDWIKALRAAGAVVSMPEIADYEVRRELIRAGATSGLVRLDLLKANLNYQPIRTSIMLQAAEFWAFLRNVGLPTAAAQELDADAILAATAATAWGPADMVTIATTNVAHLARFPGIDAREWNTIM